MFLFSAYKPHIPPLVPNLIDIAGERIKYRTKRAHTRSGSRSRLSTTIIIKFMIGPARNYPQHLQKSILTH